jgi:hypothetical protein
MKYKITKKLLIDATLDSSEMVMFTKGGKHSVSVKKTIYDDDEDTIGKIDFNSFDEILFSVQMERSEQNRFDFIDGQAKTHRNQWDKINKSEQLKPVNAEASSDS